MSTAEVADLPSGPVWTLGDRMWKARKNKRWEQSDVAAAVGVSRPLVSRWEHDLSVPNALQIKKFVEVIDSPDVTFEWLTASPCYWTMAVAPDQMQFALEATQLVA